MDGLCSRPIRAVPHLFALLMVLLSTTGMAGTTAYVRSTEQLDLKRIRLVVVAPPDWQSSLRHRVMTLFTQAGLPTPASDSSQELPLALLTLTLNPQPVGVTCPGKVLYTASLVLTEPVTIPRTGAVFQDATWVFSSETQVREPVGSEQIQEDLDRLVKQFITDYKTANAHDRFPDKYPAPLGDRPQPATLSTDAGHTHRNLAVEDLHGVHVSVIAGQWSSPLKAAALRQLAEAGVGLVTDPTTSDVISLSLELIQHSLGNHCPGYILYEQGLYLVEEVQLSRRPHVRFWSDTWVQESVQVVPPRSLRELESDQTLLLRTFLGSPR